MIRDVVIFSAGAAIGSIVTWKLIEAKYKQIADEEIASVKEVFTVRKKTTEDEEEDESEEDSPTIAEEYHNEDKPDLMEYSKIVDEEGYDSEAIESKLESKPKPIDHDEPYVISPDEFGEFDDYEQISLTYYEGDGFLADDMDELVDDIEDVVGFESLNHFGEYEEDAVHVRNDRLKADYEILVDTRSYREVHGKAD